ncbi:chorismate-binding protein [Candidatus Protochlamydia phocaeensis]|uniref:chorismate-binding protein n=1 Tax=Candidatus Protochlamydia phocaeensis TaxID=1414722 RepID=UPI0008395160|nr:chorismate-binding protein [Candidatus Protochlamydia phocaeensis]
MPATILDASDWISGALMSAGDGSFLLGYGPCRLAASRQELDPGRPIFYFPDFFLRSAAPWIQYEKSLNLTWHQLDNELKAMAGEEPLEWIVGHRELFQETFQRLQEAFQNGLLEKAVPYTFAYSSSYMSLARLQRSLKEALAYLQSRPGCLYGYWNEEGGLLGVTPETLFLYDEGQSHLVRTMALAGTKKQQEKEELQQDDKEKHEHQVVVKGICEALKPFGRIQVGERQLLPFSTLNHLLTPIEVSLTQPFDFDQLVKALHPTPALGAFPRLEGGKWLENYQKQLDRKFYGAPFGVIDPIHKRASCFVGIRQVQWSDQGMRIGAGCGVVKGSRCEQEWNEILLKIHSIRQCLAL